LFLRKVKKSFILGLFGFVAISLINGSSYGSIILISINILIYMILDKRYDYEKVNQFLNRQFFFFTILFLILLALFTKIFEVDNDIWINPSKFLPWDRLRLFMFEPSYLGMLIAPLLFFRVKTVLKMILTFTIVLTQSYLSYLYALVLLLLKSRVMTYLLFLIGFLLVLYLYAMPIKLFWQNSGIIRFIGVKLFTDFGEISVIKLLIGHGLGSGDKLLQSYFLTYGVEIANGFLFSAIYDLGLIAFLFLIRIFVRNIKELFLILVLLLNFSFGNILFVAIFFISKIMLSQRSGVSK